MPIYTCFFSSVWIFFSVFWTISFRFLFLFGCITAPPGGRWRHDSSSQPQFCTEGNSAFPACVAFSINILYSCHGLFSFVCFSIFYRLCDIFYFDSFNFFLTLSNFTSLFGSFSQTDFNINVDDLYAVLRDSLKKTRRRGEMSRNQKVYFCRTNATE